jgi:cell division protein FtsW (lipid II flippase)
MTVGMLPVTGVPLPFISYGGSSLLTWMMMAGLLVGISFRWREY